MNKMAWKLKSNYTAMLVILSMNVANHQNIQIITIKGRTGKNIPSRLYLNAAKPVYLCFAHLRQMKQHSTTSLPVLGQNLTT